jgi:uncharacterized protein YecE (DUF72 family)
VEASGRRIRVGTSGYSYADWKGPFYPRALTTSKYLAYYARYFDVVEIDATYYRIPGPRVFEAMARKVPPGFRFAVKTPSTFTHQRAQFDATLEPYRKSVLPLVRRGKLLCFLAQFPQSFRYSPENLRFVGEVSASLDRPLCVEFRHVSWQREDVYAFLADKGIGFVNVDLPRLPGLPRPSATVTASVAYVRFHGRVDAKAWWQSEEAHQRYDYAYTTAQLEEWLPRITHVAARAKETLVLFNNHFRGKAVRAAIEMRRLLGQPVDTAAAESGVLDSFVQAT